MPNIHRTFRVIFVAALLSAPVIAAPENAASQVADDQLSGGVLTLIPSWPSTSSVLRITGPEGYEASVASEAGGAVAVDLMAAGRFSVGGPAGDRGAGASLDGQYLPDGLYRYELIYYQPTGQRRLHAGKLVVADGTATRLAPREEPGSTWAAPSTRSQVVGAAPEAASSEVSDALSITDAAGDGQTELNMHSIGNGSVELANATGDFRIQIFDGVTRSAIFTGDTGRLGLNTTTPGKELDIAAATPTVRLSDTVDVLQTWDISGDDTGFAIHDVTNARVPFMIESGTPTGTLFLDSSGRVGVGTAMPGANLDVVGDGGNLRLIDFDQPNPGNGWELNDEGVLRFIPLGFQTSMTLFPGGEVFIGPGNVVEPPQARLRVAGGAIIEGDVALGSSRAIKTGLEAVNPAEVLMALGELPVASWRYKAEGEAARHVGPFAEDFQRLFGLGDGKTISIVDAQGVALAAIQGLLQTLAGRDRQIADLTARLLAVEARLALDAGAVDERRR